MPRARIELARCSQRGILNPVRLPVPPSRQVDNYNKFEYMKIDEFNYDLPKELIAQNPSSKRTDSNLMILNTKHQVLNDKKFNDFINYIKPNDLLIFNNTKVIKARLNGEKITGGKIEILVEKIIEQNIILAHVGSSKKIKTGLEIKVGNATLVVNDRKDNLFVLYADIPIHEIINNYGQLPLPPYIERKNNHNDDERYQTVFAKHEGAIAAPTAGLHFDKSFFSDLNRLNIDYDFITLHVGSGTFQPVRENEIENHKIHQEEFVISDQVYKKIKETKKYNGRIIAIGTTVLRALEAAFSGSIKHNEFQSTDIFIYPGYKFKIVDSLFTNFHLPKSTLLMLVSAFAGHKFIMSAYKHAVQKQYRFFSYGDAMFIEQKV